MTSTTTHRSRLLAGVFAGLCAALLAGCGKPVPAGKAAYVGEWQNPEMYLLLTQDGSVRYKRLSGGMSKSIEGPLKGFTVDGFEVGVGPMSTTFVVSQPPHDDGGRWKMTVDGAELTRTTRE